MSISIIVAIAANGVIGSANQIPWRLPADMKYFKETTTGHTLVMGRKCYESLGRLLPNRFSVILTRQVGFPAPEPTHSKVVHSWDEAITSVNTDAEVFVIGGAEIYKIALPYTQKMYITRINESFEGDVYFPDFQLEDWKLVSQRDFQPDEKNKYPYSFLIYERIK